MLVDEELFVTDCAVTVQVAPPSVLFRKTIPLWKPPPVAKLALQAPHHAAASYWVPSAAVKPSSAVTSAAAFAPSAVRTSKICCQLVMPAMPASEFHTIAPPAIRWFEFVRSIPMGEMKRGSGSF